MRFVGAVARHVATRDVYGWRADHEAICAGVCCPLLFFLLLSYVTSVILWGMTLSARNRLEGKVVELQFGGVMAHVVVRVGKNLIESVITKRSADEMKLKVGDKVSAVIKSTEVMLDKK